MTRAVMIARANPADVHDWARMRHALWAEVSEIEHAEEVSDALALCSARALSLIARTEDGIPAGFAEAAIRHEYVNGCDTSPVGFLEGIYVVPDFQRTGLATRLCAEVERWVRDQGCTELASDADWENPEGIAFHLGAGFEEAERVIFFRKAI